MRLLSIRILTLLLSVIAIVGLTQAAEAPGYKLIKSVSIPHDGGWDYLTVDAANRRVYISHATRVEMIDADTGEIKGEVADTPGIHGIAVAIEFGKGFTSNGKTNEVSVFDLKTLKTTNKVSVGKTPTTFTTMHLPIECLPATVEVRAQL